ncbi:hypothetical protein [Sphingobacterium spiritivorum]
MINKEKIMIKLKIQGGGIDPVTGEKISQRTYNIAVLVTLLFSDINAQKSVRNITPQTKKTVNQKYNNFINNVINSISRAY